MFDFLLLGKIPDQLQVWLRDKSLDHRVEKVGLLESRLLREVPGFSLGFHRLPLLRDGKLFHLSQGVILCLRCCNRLPLGFRGLPCRSRSVLRVHNPPFGLPSGSDDSRLGRRADLRPLLRDPEKKKG